MNVDRLQQLLYLPRIVNGGPTLNHYYVSHSCFFAKSRVQSTTPLTHLTQKYRSYLALRDAASLNIIAE